jgi:hypothetical protein
MATDTFPGAVHIAFRAALLLGGTTKTAEAAVMDGICACEELSQAGLLIEAVRFTIRQRMKSPDARPPELRRLFLLQPLLRDCFVLRILAGFSREACAALLDVSITELEDALGDALNQLPHLHCLTELV